MKKPLAWRREPFLSGTRASSSRSSPDTPLEADVSPAGRVGFAHLAPPPIEDWIKRRATFRGLEAPGKVGLVRGLTWPGR